MEGAGMMNRIVNVLIGICLPSAMMAAQRGGIAAGHPAIAPPGMQMRSGGPAAPSHGSPERRGGKLWNRDGFRHGWNQPFFGASYPADIGPSAPDFAAALSSGGVVL